MAGKQEVGLDSIGIAPITTTQSFSEYQKYVEDQREIYANRNYEDDIPHENIIVDEKEDF